MQAVHSSAVGARHEAQTRSGIQRIGGGAGVLFGIGNIIPAVVLIPLTAAYGLKPPLEGKEAQFYDFLHATLPVFMGLGLLQAVALGLGLIFVRAIDERLRPVSPTGSPIAAVYGYVGLAVVELAVVSFFTLGQTIAAGTSRNAVEPLIPAALVINGTAAFAGSAFIVVWLFMVSWIAVRRGGLPRALNYLGFFAVAVGVVTAFLSIKGIAPLVTAIWTIWAGAALWLRPHLAGPEGLADLP